MIDRLRIAAALALTALPALAQVSLDELVALARARAERQRPAQEQAMKPYWGDLMLDYEQNAEILDTRIAEVAQLGDSVVPLLLEKLAPDDDGPSGRSLAANCARVLRQLEPAAFFDALVELAKGKSSVARLHAIALLGHTGVPQAAGFLVEQLPKMREREQLQALEALAQLRVGNVAAQVVPMLGSDNRRVRQKVLEFLLAANPADVTNAVLQALEVERDNRLLPLYIDFLGTAAPGEESAAIALLPFLDRERLDWEDTRRLVEVLGKVAPEGHKPTMQAMRQIIDQGDTGQLGLAAGLTLLKLGDRGGLTSLHDNINNALRRASQDAALFYRRANLHFALENWREAISDYEKAYKNSTNSILRQKALLRITRCEAHRHRWSMVLRRLKEAQATRQTVLQMSAEDPAMREALQQDRIRAWFNALPQDG